jgi:hypothetical protein
MINLDKSAKIIHSHVNEGNTMSPNHKYIGVYCTIKKAMVYEYINTQPFTVPIQEPTPTPMPVVICDLCGDTLRHNARGSKYVDEHDTWPRTTLCDTCWLRHPHRVPNPITLEFAMAVSPDFASKYPKYVENMSTPQECEGCHRHLLPDKLKRCAGYGRRQYIICKQCNGTVFYDGWKYKHRLAWDYSNRLPCPSCQSTGCSIHKINDMPLLSCSYCGLYIILDKIIPTLLLQTCLLGGSSSIIDIKELAEMVTNDTDNKIILSNAIIYARERKETADMLRNMLRDIGCENLPDVKLYSVPVYDRANKCVIPAM